MFKKTTQLKLKVTTLTQQLGAYRALFDSSLEALLMSEDGVVVDVNVAALALWGYEREDVLNTPVVEFIPLFQKSIVLDVKNMNGEELVHVMEGRTKNGALLPLELRCRMLFTDGAELCIISARRISDNAEIKTPLLLRDDELLMSRDDLIEKERRFESLFNVSFNAYIIHIEGRILEVNDKFSELYGYTKEEAMELDVFRDLFPNTAIVKEYRAEISKEKYSCFVGQQLRKDGSLFEAEIIAKYEMLNGQKVRIVTVQDVSQLVESERNLKEKNNELLARNRELQLVRNEVLLSRKSFYRSLSEKQSQLSDEDLERVIIYGHWTYDLVNDNFSWTDEVTEIVGYGADKTSSSLDEFLEKINVEDRELLKMDFFESTKSNKLFKSEFRLTSKPGVEKFLLAQGVVEYDANGHVAMLIGTLLDISDRKQIENNLKRQKDHYLLLNEELIISRKKAEESEKLKTSFFANMSHEIRTPMNGILGFSSLLMEPELSVEERLEYSQVIVDSGKRLLHIVNDVLDISKLESDTVKVVKADVKINSLLDNLASLFSQDIKVQSGSVKFSLHKAIASNDCLMHTDQNRLSQILNNLLSNAMKFTEEGEVKFGYRLLEDKLSIFVEDTGIGIPEDMVEGVFEPFRQVEGHIVRQHGGTGLGLSISKKLVTLLGGEMALETKEGQGSRFCFTLPYKKIPPVVQQEEVLVSQNVLKDEIKDVCLLIAEDDDVNYLFYQSFLGNKLKLLRASDGQEAVDMVEKYPEIDAILMDVKMPVMGGYEATKLIKATHPSLPIIAQTAYAMAEDKRLALESGADDYISKPINRRQLLEKLKELCLAK